MRAEPGETFGLLTVVRELPPDRTASQSYRRVLVRCQCGAEKEVRVASLTRGYARSCGEGACWHLVRHGYVPKDIHIRKRKRGGEDMRRRQRGEGQ